MKITEEQKIEIQAHLNMWKTLIDDFEMKQKRVDPDSVRYQALDNLIEMYMDKVDGADTVLSILGYEINEEWKLEEEDLC